GAGRESVSGAADDGPGPPGISGTTAQPKVGTERDPSSDLARSGQLCSDFRHDEPPDRGLLPADGSGTVPVEEPMVLESRERAGPEGWPQDHPKRARRSWALRARDGVLAVLLCGGAGTLRHDLYPKAQVGPTL